MVPAVRRTLRRIPVAGLAIAGLLAATVGLSVGRTIGRSRAIHDIDAAISREADHKVESVRAFTDQASTISALVARDPTLAMLLVTDTTDARQRVELALTQLASAFPARTLAEASVIDQSGRELARIVDGKLAPAPELSADESTNTHFQTAMHTPVGTPYRAAPYRSPDTGEIVLATSIVIKAGNRRAILHTEVRADRIRELVANGPRTWVLDGSSGIAIVDSDHRLPLTSLPAYAFPISEEATTGWGSVATEPTEAQPFAAIKTRPNRGAITMGKHRVTFRSIPRAPHDDSSLQVAVESSESIGPFTGFNATSTLLVFLGLLSAGAAFVNRRRATAAQTRAERDELTGLGNRRMLTSELTQRIADARATGGSFSLAMIDLDEFKEVNDTLGHDAGDKLLVVLAQRLRRHSRNGDMVTRLGGDEFAAILADTPSENEARLAADRLIEVFGAPVEIDGVPITVRASVGLAVFPDDGNEPSGLLRCADVAMYRAKSSQQGIALYDAEADPHHPDRLRLLADLREAIELGDIHVVYQPVINLATGRVVSAEALARWTHPTLGFVSPGEFIPLAESFGLMRPLTRLVLRKSLTAMTAWMQAGLELSVAVNLSATSIVEADCAQQVSRALRQHGVDPSRLTLEITESAVIADPRRAQVTLESLHRLGVRLAVDDYGTGNASIGYLRTMPFDVLKLDRSFVMGLTSNAVDRSIIRSTINLSRDLGLAVVAEGVETIEESAMLREFGCDMVQGFLYSPGLPGPKFVEWAKSRQSASSQPGAPPARSIL
jgi:diguanylate cyclase (GGDEF)-like protein